MIQSVTVTNYLGEKIHMVLTRPEDSGFAITKIDGLGPGKADINISEIATTDGGVYNSARMDSRNIVLNLKFWGTELKDWEGKRYNASIEELRQLTYKYFPLKSNVSVVIETDNRIGEIQGYVESNEPDIFSKEEGCQISIMCPDPMFYAHGQTVDTTLYGVEPLFEFPFENNSLTEPLLEMGELMLRFDGNILYEGDGVVGMEIHLHLIDRAENINIYNVNTKESMHIDTDKIASITGSALASGDEIIINTFKGQKSLTLLRSGRKYNILNAIKRDADWFQLSKGDNVFTFTADYGRTNIQFKALHKIGYEGM